MSQQQINTVGPDRQLEVRPLDGRVVWTVDRVEQLLTLRAQGLTNRRIGHLFGVTEVCVGAKIDKLRKAGVYIPYRKNGPREAMVYAYKATLAPAKKIFIEAEPIPPLEPIEVAQGTGPKKLARIVVEAVAIRHRLTADAILGPDRSSHIVVARDEAIAEAHRLRPYWPYTVLGMAFNRDHTTILHSLQKAGLWKAGSTKEARRARYEQLAQKHEGAAP